MANHSTILSRLLQLVYRHDFRKIEQQGFAPRRKYRALSRWSRFTAMMFTHSREERASAISRAISTRVPPAPVAGGSQAGPGCVAQED